MKILNLISLPVIGAIIGWLTNWVAVKLLFRPHLPVNLLGYKIQGVIPKRRAELARSIAEVVERELVSVEDLIQAARSGEAVEKISEAVADAVRCRIMDRIPAFVPVSVKKMVSDLVTDQVREELPHMVGELFDQAGATIREAINFQAIVESRVNAFSLERLEQVILSVAARELRHIEILGGVLGFLIGLVQVGILLATGYLR